MNERIRLLAEQAFFDNASSQPSDRMYTFSDHKMQQFAELIVEKCIGQFIQHGVVSADGTIVKDIQKHFGVES